MLTSIVLSLLLAALGGINPVQHSEARAPQDTTTSAAKAPNPVQHSE